MPKADFLSVYFDLDIDSGCEIVTSLSCVYLRRFVLFVALVLYIFRFDYWRLNIDLLEKDLSPSTLSPCAVTFLLNFGKLFLREVSLYRRMGRASWMRDEPESNINGIFPKLNALNHYLKAEQTLDPSAYSNLFPLGPIYCL